MSNVKPGPKGQVDTSPVPMVRFPRYKAKRIERFAKTYLKIPKGQNAGKPFRLEVFQRELGAGLFAPGIRMGLVSIARGNAKSTLAAVYAVYDLFTTPGAQVVVVASDQRQAGIVLGIAKRLIETSPELAKRARVLKDHIEVPGTGGEMYALPADVGALQGWDPSLCIVDELAYVTRPVWESIVGFSGKRPESLTLAISTPSDRLDSVMTSLVELGRSASDPSFFFKEFISDEKHPITCEHCWEAANPALDLFLSRDGMRSLLSTMREPAFRRFRLNQQVTPSTAWFLPEQWKARIDQKRIIKPREPVCLGFDGSVSGDASALVACTVNDPHVWLLGLWERPDGDDEWRVPRLEVASAVEEAFRDLNVIELACDPFAWRGEIAQWARKFGRTRVIEFPTNVKGRMGPAVDLMTEAVLEGKATHTGDPDLMRHVLNAQVLHTKYGDQISKPTPKSPQKIDAAVAMCIAHARAAHHASTKKTRRLKAVSAGW
ncbi:terminase large subunit [Nocardioides ginsengisoli]|uniref:Terminase large subunit domain-containing protein n=1 Tax=Nocardioides ginsengisoli TaxID=363868 RepID=A0ABW3W4I8_9ACTN